MDRQCDRQTDGQNYASNSGRVTTRPRREEDVIERQLYVQYVPMRMATACASNELPSLHVYGPWLPLTSFARPTMKQSLSVGLVALKRDASTVVHGNVVILAASWFHVMVLKPA